MRQALRHGPGARWKGTAALAVALAPALAATPVPARAQTADLQALAYLAIPLDGRSGRDPRYGLRLDLEDRQGPGPDAPDQQAGVDRPPLLELRPGFGGTRVSLAGVDVRAARAGLGLDGGGSAWLWIGGGCAAAAVLAVVIAVGDVCLGINAGCRRDKDEDEDYHDDRRGPVAVRARE